MPKTHLNLHGHFLFSTKVLFRNHLSDEGVCRTASATPDLLGKPSGKKNGLVMEVFRKGSDPPPLFPEVMEPVTRGYL